MDQKERDAVERDRMLFGTGIAVDGKRVDPATVTIFDAPTVTVPVEPTDAMFEAGFEAMARAEADGVDQAPSEVWSAMLAAAPAAPQAAGVGEDDGARLLWNRFAVAHHESWDDEPNKAEYRQAAADVLALRAPSREPEGGAVDDGAFKIATDLHAAYEQLIYGLPKYLDAENLTDEENMIREAWVTLDVTAHRLAALVTREEAPAEAGDLQTDFTRSHPSGMDDTTYSQIEDALDRADAPIIGPDRKFLTLAQRVDALCTQPPAREDAQPVELVSKAQSFDAEVAWLHEAARYFSARDTNGEDLAHWANVYNAENANKLADRLAELSSSHRQLPPAPDAQPVAWRGRDLDAFGDGSWAVCSFKPSCDEVQPLYTRPTSDALRVAVGALEEIRDSRTKVVKVTDARAVAAKALAALQAEQGAK